MLLTCTPEAHALTVTRQRDPRVPLISRLKMKPVCSKDVSISYSRDVPRGRNLLLRHP
jgi:hypothetical protein